MKRVIAVYDLDPFYADRFAKVANQKETVPFTIIAFTSIERLSAYMEENPVEILLVDICALDLVRDLPARQIFTLTDGEFVAVEEGFPNIYKYQSADGILREVMAGYHVEADQELAPVGKPSCLIGVYSPVNRCFKTSFCLSMGQIISKEQKVLYLNLEDCSSLSKLMPESFKGDLSDAFYYYQQGLYNWVKMATMVYTWGTLDYIAPARYPEDLSQMSSGQVAEFLECIAGEGVYDVIIVDIGQYGRLAADILDVCRVVYMPVREDGISKFKIEVFEDYLEASGRKRLKDRIQKLKLPSSDYRIRGEHYLEQLMWGEMGDYVRQLLKGKTEWNLV